MEEHTMGDQSTDTSASNQDGNTPSEPTSGAGDEFKPITSQEEFEARLKDRLARERSKFSDYDELKAKAAKHDELEAANKSEIERANDAKAAAEERAAKAEADALRLRIATTHGITDQDDIDLFLTGTDEETLTKQAERLAARSEEGAKPRPPVPDPTQGRNNNGSPMTTAERFAAAFQDRV